MMNFSSSQLTGALGFFDGQFDLTTEKNLGCIERELTETGVSPDLLFPVPVYKLTLEIECTTQLSNREALSQMSAGCSLYAFWIQRRRN